MVLVGKKIVDYVSKKTSKNVKGINLYVVRDCDDYEKKLIVGQIAESLYISADSSLYDVTLSLELGDKFDISYNRFGSITSLFRIK